MLVTIKSPLVVTKHPHACQQSDCMLGGYHGIDAKMVHISS